EAGRLEEAIREYRDAAPIVSNLPTDDHGRFTQWVALARIQIDLSRLLATSGKNQEAASACREVLAMRDRLEKEFAGKPKSRRDLASSHVDMGFALKK